MRDDFAKCFGNVEARSERIALPRSVTEDFDVIRTTAKIALWGSEMYGAPKTTKRLNATLPIDGTANRGPGSSCLRIARPPRF